MAADIANGESGLSARTKINSRFGNSTFVDYPNGITLSGGADVLDTYDEQDIDISSSGDFDASQSGTPVRITKFGRIVTITTDGTLTHTSSSSPASASGFIPASCRPISNTVKNIYSFEATRVAQLNIATDGTLSCTYLDWAGSATAKGSTNGPITITYTV